MMITRANIRQAIAIAEEIFSRQTVEELIRLKGHLGAAFDEVAIISEITTDMILRIAQVERADESRALSPLDDLTEQALQTYRARFGA